MNYRKRGLLIKTKNRIIITRIIKTFFFDGIFIVLVLHIASKSAWNYDDLSQELDVPDPPRNLIVSINKIGGIRLHWEPPIYDGGSHILGYNIYYSMDTEGSEYNHYIKIIGNQTTIDLKYDDMYYNTTWVITALNEYGESEYSNEAKLSILPSEFDFIKAGLMILTIFFGILTLLLGYKEFKTYYNKFFG